MDTENLNEETLDDFSDRLVADFSDRLARGESPRREEYLSQVPEAQRDQLERCLAMVEAGLAQVPARGATLEPGSVLDGFRIERVLGRGGMAVVYLAEELRLERRVALKILRPGLATERRHVDRFRREALAVARIRHPHILQVYSVGEADGYHYIAMEHADGPSLADVLETLPSEREWSAGDLAEATGVSSLAREPSFERALAFLLAPVARAVAVAHEMGIIHRDIKPSNILIHRDGRAVITDFGLAREDGNLALSLTGEVLGTPFYMSPEQVLQGERNVDARTDIYSLGVTLYEALTGKRPFEGKTPYAVFDAIRNVTPVALRSVAAGRSRDAQALVRKAMAKAPERRYPSVMDLAVDLEALARGEATQARFAEGSVARRALSALAAAGTGRGLEYRSRRSFLGLPLVHINLGPPDRGRRRRAKGWLAIGDVATGGFALGGVAFGGIAFGGCSAGAVSIGGGAVGLFALGGGALGLLALGGAAVGVVAFGGGAVGYYAAGGGAFGAHVISGARIDDEAVRWFSEYAPWLMDYLRSLAPHRFPA